MIDNSRLYEKVLVEDGLNELKYLRDSWSYSPSHPAAEDYTDLTCVCGRDADQYSFIMEEAKKSALETIITTVYSLLGAYGIDAKPVQLSANDVKFATTFVHNNTIYIFRRFGIKNRYPDEVIEKLKEALGVSDYKYIIPMEGEAFAEVINHDDNEADPSRGTHSYTLQYFFSEFFPEGEYDEFKKYYDKYAKAVRKYFGISVVKTLQPNTLFSYKQNVRDALREFNYQAELRKICPKPYLSYKQKSELEKQFFMQGYSATLTGKLPFATCFMTAEWLYDSLKETGGSIDYSAVSMGFFKALEQFLYDFIGYHTTEKDGKPREIQFVRDGDYVAFSDKIYKEEKSHFTIGAMASFLKDPRQADLFNPNIESYTKKIIGMLLSKASVSRNGYFHKDNIERWNKVEQDRTLTYLLFYLILGAYMFDGDAFAHFGFEAPAEKDDAEKLFEYFHKKSFAGEALERPILYFGEDKDKNEYFIPTHDSHIEYDNYGDPKYSGMYYYLIGKSEFIHKIDRGNLPDVVCEGRFILGRTLPISVTLTGPEKVVFKDGVFLA